MGEVPVYLNVGFTLASRFVRDLVKFPKVEPG